jgi:hypothetical protein
MVGSWTTTAGEIELPQGINETGMVGATWTITDQGKMTENFDGSSPLDVGGSFAPYLGTEVVVITLPPASATSGKILESALVSSTIELGGHVLGAVPFSQKVGDPVGSWSCHGNSMTMTFTTAIDTEIFDFQRTAG